MRTALLISASISLLALAACSPRIEVNGSEHRDRVSRTPLKTISKLDCPEKQGELRKVSAAADGQSCVYAGAEAEVVLRLLAMPGGDAEAALAPIEADLKTLMPARKTMVATQGVKAEGDTARIRLPGVSIDAHGDKADIKIGGLTINANDDTAEVRVSKNLVVRDGDASRSVQVSETESRKSTVVRASSDEAGDVDIKADRDGAEIRHRRGGDGVRATLILASDKATSGYRVVGYEARGPKGGPMAVAIVKAKDRDGGDHDIFKDMKALVRHNVGG
jgi:hypothetical protein